LNKLTKFIGAGLLSLICTTTASANPVVTLLVNDPALDAVKWTGTEVVIDGPICEERDVYGFYRFRENPRVDVLTLCISKHETVASLLDTIRHEAIHVGQVCRDGAIFKESFVAKHASPAMQENITKLYPNKEHHAYELEAVVVASQTNQQEVADLIYEVCKSPES
jgi:hypothetical protein